MSEKKRPVVGIMTGQFNVDNSIRFLKFLAEALKGTDVDIRFYFGGVSTVVLEKYSMDDIGFGCHHYSLYSYSNYDAPDLMVVIFGSINVGQKQPMVVKEFVKYIPRVPVILLKEEVDLPDNPGSIAINIDNYGGMKECVLHLIKEHGARRIGYISGAMGHKDSELRQKAYKDALEENGIAYDESYVVYGDYQSHVDGIVEELFDRHSDFDAIVSANDEMATAVYRVAKARGIEPGKDLAVTGFDDIAIAAYMEPPLTTVLQDYYLIAVKTAEKIKEYLAGRKIESELVPVKFVVRASCGCTYNPDSRKDETKYPGEQELLMNNWMSVTQAQMRSLVSPLTLRNLQMSTFNELSFFEKLAEQLMHLNTRSSMVCLLEEPITMKDGEMLKAPEKLKLYMRQWGDKYEFYDHENAPDVYYGDYGKYLRKSDGAPIHMTNFILFHGRTQYGLLSVEISLDDAMFYETLSLEIGSALYSLYVSLKQQSLQSMLEEKNQILDYAATHDELTGMLNRTGVMSRIVDFIHAEKLSEESPFLIFMADLDHLKQINDTFGHHEGDEAIKTAAEAIKRALPEGSPFGRTGGDEFAGIMKSPGDLDAVELRQKIREFCDTYNERSGKDYYVDISLGCCKIYAGALPGMLKEAMNQADKKLYEAKKSRRESVLRSAPGSPL